jgi:hypothetical protein
MPSRKLLRSKTARKKVGYSSNSKGPEGSPSRLAEIRQRIGVIGAHGATSHG